MYGLGGKGGGELYVVFLSLRGVSLLYGVV
jgi:hypothetical protein